MKPDLETGFELVFGKNFEYCNEQDVTDLYNRVRERMRYYYTHSRPTTFKICDKCERTYPKLTDGCNYCGGKLREFEVPFTDKYMKTDYT